MGLRASGEDYLEVILVLQKQKGVVRSVDVARHLEVSKPSVSHAVTTLKEGGFHTMDEDFFLHLTDLGREVAEQTYEKHRFFTDLLTEAWAGVKFPWSRNRRPSVFCLLFFATPSSGKGTRKLLGGVVFEHERYSYLAKVHAFH